MSALHSGYFHGGVWQFNIRIYWRPNATRAPCAPQNY